jgi:hypothetical protein
MSRIDVRRTLPTAAVPQPMRPATLVLARVSLLGGFRCRLGYLIAAPMRWQAADTQHESGSVGLGRGQCAPEFPRCRVNSKWRRNNSNKARGHCQKTMTGLPITRLASLETHLLIPGRARRHVRMPNLVNRADWTFYGGGHLTLGDCSHSNGFYRRWCHKCGPASIVATISCASAISGNSRVGAHPSRTGERTAWASVRRAVD